MEGSKYYNRLLEKLSTKKGIVFLLGHSDSGKTTFCAKLISRALDRSKSAALVDSDVGQSTVGPPSCIGAQVFTAGDKANKVGENFWQLYFVGSTSPRGNFLPMVTGTYSLARRCLEKAGLVIIDTTGLVQGDYGQALKYHKINLISPRYLVLFEKGEELVPYKEIFLNLKNINVCCLEMGKGLNQKSSEQRAMYRQEKFFQYFKAGRQVSLQPRKLGSFPPLSRLLKRIKKFSLLGLCNQDGGMLGLGIFLGLGNEGDLRVYTPVANVSEVRFILLGRIKITTRGKQL
ncbi:MAG: Clp1/GlmU family protein [Actinomycetota bacterium]